jgi:hypothetical protein
MRVLLMSSIIRFRAPIDRGSSTLLPECGVQAVSLLVNSSFSPDDLDVLRSALDDWCAERRIDIRSVEAQFAASTALDLYQAGYDSREKLLHALRDHRIA